MRVVPTRKDLLARLMSRRKVVDGCWVFDGCLDSCGYGRITHQGKQHSTHRVAWIEMVGDPGDLHVLHQCDRRSCFNPDHLMLGTHQENMKQRDAWGNGIRGEAVGCSILTAEQVLEARALRADTDICWEPLAARYGVTASTIRHAVTGRSWKHLERV